MKEDSCTVRWQSTQLLSFDKLNVFGALLLTPRLQYVVSQQTSVLRIHPTQYVSGGCFDAAGRVHSGQCFRRVNTSFDGAARQPCSTWCGLRCSTSSRGLSSRPQNDGRYPGVHANCCLHCGCGDHGVHAAYTLVQPVSYTHLTLPTIYSV